VAVIAIIGYLAIGSLKDMKRISIYSSHFIKSKAGGKWQYISQSPSKGFEYCTSTAQLFTRSTGLKIIFCLSIINCFLSRNYIGVFLGEFRRFETAHSLTR
jgi:hypothetical protein